MKLFNLIIFMIPFKILNFTPIFKFGCRLPTMTLLCGLHQRAQWKMTTEMHPEVASRITSLLGVLVSYKHNQWF